MWWSAKMGILQLIEYALSLTGTILVNKGVIGQNTDNLVTGLLTPLNELIAAFKTKQAGTSPYLAVLAAMIGAIAVLKTTTGLPQAVLDDIDAIAKDAQAALAGWATAGKGLDLTLYSPIAEV